MTIIISFKKNNAVWIACDRYITYGDIVINPKQDSKLVYMANAIIAAGGDLTIRNHLELFISKGENIAAPFYTKNDVMQFFLNFKRYMNKVSGLGEAEHNQLQQMQNAGFLVATRDKIFEVNEDGGILEFDQFAATGRGEEMGIALLEYFYLYKKNIDPNTMTKRIMKVVYKYQNSCGGPFTLINVTETLD